MLRCKQITYPNVFDDKQQYCDNSDNSFCLGKDMNMFCSDVIILLTVREALREKTVLCRKNSLTADSTPSPIWEHPVPQKRSILILKN